MNSPVQNLLSRLDKVKEKSPGKWQACCPAHGDKDPSLAITTNSKENDGRVLMKCFAGCESLEIVHSIGMELSDLFPDSSRKNFKPIRQKRTPDQIVEEFQPGEELTDLGNADRYIFTHGDNVRFVYGWNWIVWNGRFWEMNNASAKRLACETVRKLFIEAALQTDRAKQDGYIRWARRSQDASRLNALLSLASIHENVISDPSKFDTNPNFLNVANGVIDLRTGDLLPHGRDYFITKMIDVEYKENAFSKLWNDTILEIFGGDNDLAAYFQRVVGYSLTGLNTEQVLFFFYGNGANGKSTVKEAIFQLLGDFAKAAKIDTFIQRRNNSNSNDVARLAGVRMVTVSETAEGERLKLFALDEIERRMLAYQEKPEAA